VLFLGGGEDEACTVSVRKDALLYGRFPECVHRASALVLEITRRKAAPPVDLLRKCPLSNMPELLCSQ